MQGLSAQAELAAPTDPVWKEGSTATATWDSVDGANYYSVKVFVYLNGESIGDTLTGTASTEIDLQSEIESVINNAGRENSAYEACFEVKAVYQDDSTNIESEASAKSPMQPVKPVVNRLATPTSLELSEGGVLTWEGFDENASRYYAELWFHGDGGTIVGCTFPADEVAREGARASFDLSAELRKYYAYTGLAGGAVPVSVMLRALAPEGVPYSNSLDSAWSNEIVYVPEDTSRIDSITLSPSHPILAVGRSIYIGKTISPEDARYSVVNWSSDNQDVFAVGNDGLVTGVAPGNANLTVQIKEATATVPVSVYELTTNVSDEDEAELVRDTANDAIESVVNDGDATGTDITDVDAARDTIENAAQEGDQFSADLNAEEVGKDELEVSWDEVAAFAQGEQFGSAYDVRIAVGFTNDEGEFNLVGNLTELDGAVSFDVPIPDDLPPVQDGEQREYKLVLIHDGEMEYLPYTMSDGKLHASSDRFSDFVVVYNDVKKHARRDFSDVKAGAWYRNVVKRAVSLGLVMGYEDGRFGPNDNITRGQAAVILWRMAGMPKAGAGAKAFPDVKKGAYYESAVRWASSVGVVSGYASGKFGPDDKVTREQLAVMLANYAKRVAGETVSGSKADFGGMKDADKVAVYAQPAMGWCFRNKILTGSNGNVMPKGNAKRAEAAKMLVGLYDLMN